MGRVPWRVRALPGPDAVSAGPRTSVAVVALAVSVLAACSAAAPAGVAAQASLTTGVDTTRITVGDRLTLDVRVEHPADAVVSWPDSVDLAPFEVLDVRIRPMRARQDGAVSTAAFSLTAFELGELELPGFPVTVLHPDGREETFPTDAYTIEVVSVGVDETGDIREIRGPLSMPVGLLRILSLVLLLLLLAVAARVIWRRSRKDEDGEVMLPAPAPRRPPHEVALEALDALEAGRLLQEGQVKEFHIRVSGILRRYVEARYRVPALEMTTWEVIDGLESAGVAEGIRGDLRRFLDRCDLVKFAKARPGEEESRRILRLGREIVERSIPEESGAPHARSQEPDHGSTGPDDGSTGPDDGSTEPDDASTGSDDGSTGPVPVAADPPEER